MNYTRNIPQLSFRAISILLFVSILFICGCKKGTGDTDNYFVKARTGLVLRSKATTSSKKITTIPYKAAVTVVEYSGKEETIGGVSAPWARVKYGNKTGWVFSGFLSNGELASGKGAAPAPDNTKKFHKNVVSFINNPFAFRFVNKFISANLKNEIISVLKKPLKVETENIENMHDPGIQDSIYTIKYTGLEMKLYHAKAGKKQMLNMMTITNPSFRLKHDLKKGISLSRIKSIFGEPASKSGNTYVYPDDSSGNSLEFHVKGNKLSQIVVIYPAGL
ncbi:MAG: SH3 domain-containing protein [bacterium]|nr:SH3 domain-containing protein [bacterium]